jgi:hypothetical protein
MGNMHKQNAVCMRVKRDPRFESIMRTRPSLAKRVHGSPKDRERTEIIPGPKDLLLWMVDQGMWPFDSSYSLSRSYGSIRQNDPSHNQDSHCPLSSKLHFSGYTVATAQQKCLCQDPICFARASIHSFDVKTLSFSPTTNSS